MEGRSSNSRRNNKKKKKSKSSRKERLQQRLGSHESTAESSASQQKPPPVSVVLEHADAAVERSDLSAALQLYSHAIEALRSTLPSNDNDVDDDAEMKGNQNSNDNENQNLPGGATGRLELAKVLGKRGETLVSMEDREAARSDFQQAIDLLTSGASSENGSVEQKEPANLDSDDAQMKDANCDGDVAGPKIAAGDTGETAQWYEIRAGLYLFLGQLSSGEDGALHFYRSGIADYRSALEILSSTSNLVNVSDERTAKELSSEVRRKLCGAYCSVAELYLTDLCFDPDAEQQCEESLQAAQEIEASSSIPLQEPDVPQTLANLRVSQRRVDEATDLLLEAYGRMRPGCEALANLVGLGPASTGEGEQEPREVDPYEAKELVNVEAANSLPGFEFRSQTAKLLLECALSLQESLQESGKDCTMSPQELDVLERRGEQCVEASVVVLGSLLAENEDVAETWYLLGCAFVTAKNEDAAKEYLERALEMLSAIRAGLEKTLSGKRDVSMRDENDELAEGDELVAQLKDVGMKMSDVRKKIAELPHA